MEKIIVKRIKGRELSDTLRSMKVGEEILFKACYRLKREGFLFSCSSKKNIDGSKVIRLS